MEPNINLTVGGQLTVVHTQDPEVLRRLDALEALITKQGEQFMALSDDLKAGLAAVKQDVADVAAEVADLRSKMTPGDPVTQDMVDQVNAIHAGLKAVEAAPTPPAAG